MPQGSRKSPLGDKRSFEPSRKTRFCGFCPQSARKSSWMSPDGISPYVVRYWLMAAEMLCISISTRECRSMMHPGLLIRISELNIDAATSVMSTQITIVDLDGFGGLAVSFIAPASVVILQPKNTNKSEMSETYAA